VVRLPPAWLCALSCWFCIELGTAAVAACEVEAARARLARVVLQIGGRHHTLTLDGLPVQVTARAGRDSVRLQVLSPLRFATQYPLRELPFRINATVDLKGGRVRLGKGAAPEVLRVDGDRIEFSLRRLLQVDIEPPLAVPCGDLTLGNGLSYHPATEAAYHPPNAIALVGSVVATGDVFFPLYLTPDELDPLLVKFVGAFDLRERRPGWILLSREWDDGSVLRGWTPERFASGERAGKLSSWGPGLQGLPDCSSPHGDGARDVVVRKSAWIAASPAGTIWASAAIDFAARALPLDRSDGWIRLIGFKGLLRDTCQDPDYIWVHSRDTH
jgi:hypothetical protein